MGRFYIFGLPRSMTTWLATFFCGKDSFCFHDLSKRVESIHEIYEIMDKVNFDHVGLADTGLYAFGFKPKKDDRILIVHRNQRECLNSLLREFQDFSKEINDSFRYYAESLNLFKENNEHLLCKFENLSSKEEVKKISNHLIPGSEWDEERYLLWSESVVNIKNDSYLKSVNENCLALSGLKPWQ
jgi:hypothetical protein